MNSKKRQAMETTDLSALLPEDVLAGILGRLAPRGVATCRCVCKAWRAVIDAHSLVRAELLPRSLAGVLVNFHGLCVTEFFSRPGSAADSSYVFVKHDGDTAHAARHRHGSLQRPPDVRAHGSQPCHGMARSPAPKPPPRVDEDSFDVRHLVYDPAISPHYEVFLLPRFRYKRERGPTYLGPWREYDPMVCRAIRMAAIGEGAVGREVVYQRGKSCSGHC
ncbi:unnamed protein product [Urochloa decumbens]|uniref:F-box domain-containing protein n=1 Tax=Urochloa decumbens TaxID=240449 RepID=A0ABC8X162_9POAL